MEENKGIKWICKRIEGIAGKETQTCPEYYAELLFEIMVYGGLEKSDIKRFLKYIVSEIEKKCQM